MKKLLKIVSVILLVSMFAVCFAACRKKSSDETPSHGKPAPSAEFTVSFDTDGGSAVPAIMLAGGAAVSAPADPAKEGYTFVGWFLGESATAYEFSTMPEGNIILTAHWTANKYTVTFDSNGGTEITAAEVTYGENYGELLVPEKTGYAFAGWFDNPELTGERIPDGQTYPVAGDVTLYARWTPVEYTVSYELDGGTNDPANPSVYTIEDLGSADGTILLKDPEKATKEELVSNGDGSFNIHTTTYTFEGWYTDAAFTTPVTELSLSLGTVTLYAKWSASTSQLDSDKNYLRINADGTPNDSGEYILFGEYPQTRVTGEGLLDELGGYDPDTWTSYGYYVSGSVNSFMKYTDKEYGGEKYRGVHFTQYRPYYCGSSSSASNSYQDDNGYDPSTVYWFRYEPIKWRILNESGGNALILCETAIDSQQFDYRADKTYKNNYKESTIRKWLNDTFYNTAFNDEQKALIQTTLVDNSVSSTGYDTNSYVCADTSDKIFLLSYKEATNAAYGFVSDGKTADQARQKKSTDYAKAQGYGQSTSYPGNCYWWLRSPAGSNGSIARGVDDDGDVNSSYCVDDTDGGVVPALTISL